MENIAEPTYCDFYKNLLVEEIFYIDHPIDLHYGKCSIIGIIDFDEDNRGFELKNIKIPRISKEYQLPSGCIKVLLVTTVYKKSLPINKTVEVFGEAVLWNKNLPNNDMANILSYTSKDLFLMLQQNTGKKSFSHEKMQEIFKPAIKVHSVMIVDQSSELIACNLEIKLMKLLRQQRLDCQYKN